MRFAPLAPKPKPSNSAKLKVKRGLALDLASTFSSASSHSSSPENSQLGLPVVDVDLEHWSGSNAVRNSQPIDDDCWLPLHRAKNTPGLAPTLPGRRLPKLEVGDPASVDPCLRNFKYGSPAILPKLEVGDVNDPLEREADELADKVMRMPAPMKAGGRTFADQRSLPGSGSPVAHRKCASCAAEEDELLRRVMAEPVSSRACSTCEDEDQLRRACASCAAEGELQRACASRDPKAEQIRGEPGGGLRGGGVSGSFATDVRGRARLGGSPLSSSVRGFLEPRFGVELKRIRVHADVEAGSLARKINARAFTLGKDIFFAQGELRPQTHSGMRLLAHEVAHTLQTAGRMAPGQKPQGSVGVTRALDRDVTVRRAPPVSQELDPAESRAQGASSRRKPMASDEAQTLINDVQYATVKGAPLVFVETATRSKLVMMADADLYKLVSAYLIVLERRYGEGPAIDSELDRFTLRLANVVEKVTDVRTAAEDILVHWPEYVREARGGLKSVWKCIFEKVWPRAQSYIFSALEGKPPPEMEDEELRMGYWSSAKMEDLFKGKAFANLTLQEFGSSMKNLAKAVAGMALTASSASNFVWRVTKEMGMVTESWHKFSAGINKYGSWGGGEVHGSRVGDNLRASWGDGDSQIAEDGGGVTEFAKFKPLLAHVSAMDSVYSCFPAPDQSRYSNAVVEKILSRTRTELIDVNMYGFTSMRSVVKERLGSEAVFDPNAR